MHAAPEVRNLRDPERVSALAALKCCANARELALGRRIHQTLVDGVDARVAAGLVNMYAKCGCMPDARRVFDKVTEEQRDVFLWNALISGYVENSQAEEALHLVEAMSNSSDGSSSSRPNSWTYVAALKACASLAESELKFVNQRATVHLERAMALHREVKKNRNTFVDNSLVNLYSKCGSMADALRVFHEMKQHDVVSWNSLLLGFTLNGEHEKCLSLVTAMQGEGYTPDSRTYVIALKACVNSAAKEKSVRMGEEMVKLVSLERGMSLHSQAAVNCLNRSEKVSDMILRNALVDMYSKCGSMKEARWAFNGMNSHSSISWTTLMSGYVESGDAYAALELFQRMLQQGFKPDPRTFVAALKACTSLADKNEQEKVVVTEIGMAVHSEAVKSGCDSEIFVASSLVDMYAKTGNMVDARRVFDGMKHRNVVSWNSLMLGYAENGEGEEALDLFWSMECERDSWTVVAALKACGGVADLQAGKVLQCYIFVSEMEKNVMVVSCLVDFYARCGMMSAAHRVFDSVTVCSVDVVSWNALIAGYCRQGETKRVFELFQEMVERGLNPNRVTFLSVFTSCSQAGLFERGKKYFQRMKTRYGIDADIEHYHCMVDLLGRANRLEEALAMVRSMPFKANAVTWTTVLSACEKWKNVTVGKVAFDSLVELDKTNAGAYVLMGNIFGSAGLWDEVAKLPHRCNV